MPVMVRFLDHASCSSVIPLDPTRHRRLLAVQPACRIAPICSGSSEQRLRPTCCSVYVAPLSKENAFQHHKITLALIGVLHMCALLALTLSRSTHLRETRHMCIQDIPTTNTRFLCVSRIMACASQRSQRPLSRRHRKPLRAAKMPAPERLLPHDTLKRRHAATWRWRAAIAAAALRWLRPAAGAPPACKGRVPRAQTPAATPQSLT